jgi:tetratricopeptide (TPR) repeat protein
MTATNLRAYNRDIEAMIDRGQNEDAVIHCKYILKFFPKHVGTYRLLGKAFLESHHYSEAADILQRVLSVIPDDFISHIGMSIIREDEGNMDAAIWHMERAFEVQPSNTAVQGELRRLYGLRDGIEPPKVRLTRGALVRMYAKSDLYPQAIAELNAALAEDPQRVDLEIILAQMYFKSGKKIEAAEICSRLIGKLPYCLEANQLLAEILPASSKAEEAKVFTQRLVSLDPYFGHISSTTPLADDVPDAAVSLERFEAVSQDTRIQPLTTETMPATIETDQQDKIPEWLPKTQEVAPVDSPFQPTENANPSQQLQTLTDQVGPNKEIPPMSQDEPVPSMDKQIPDWMREAGWSQSEDNEPVSKQPQTEAGKEEEEIVPADLPDWLKSMAPPDAPGTSPLKKEDEEKLGILNTIFPKAPEETPGNAAEEESAFESTGGAVTRLFSEDSIREAEKLARSTQDANSIPASAPSAQNEEKAEQLPDWLKTPQTAKPEAQVTPVSPISMDSVIPQPSQEDTESSVKNENPTDWLEALAKESHVAPEAAVPPLVPAEEQPESDWIKGIFNEPVEKQFDSPLEKANPSIEPVPEENSSTALPAENFPAWLKQPSPSEEDIPAFHDESIKPQTEFIPQFTEPQPADSYVEPPTQPRSTFPEVQSVKATESDKEELPDWLQELETSHSEPQQTVQPSPAAANIDPSLKEWLDTLDAEKESGTKAPSKSESLKAEVASQSEPQPQAEALVMSDVNPESVEIHPEVKAGVTVSLQEEELGTDQPVPEITTPQPVPVPMEKIIVPPVEEKVPPPPTISVPEVHEQPKPKIASVKKHPAISINADELLSQARNILVAGKIDDAIGLYTQLIRSNEKAEEIIRDLQDASSRHPLDVSLWQTLGDCYAKNKQLQEALNAYTKAEELLR